jgi:hypothetical protein
VSAMFFPGPFDHEKYLNILIPGILLEYPKQLGFEAKNRG